MTEHELRFDGVYVGETKERLEFFEDLDNFTVHVHRPTGGPAIEGKGTVHDKELSFTTEIVPVNWPDATPIILEYRGTIGVDSDGPFLNLTWENKNTHAHGKDVYHFQAHG